MATPDKKPEEKAPAAPAAKMSFVSMLLVSLLAGAVAVGGSAGVLL